MNGNIVTIAIEKIPFMWLKHKFDGKSLLVITIENEGENTGW